MYCCKNEVGATQTITSSLQYSKSYPLVIQWKSITTFFSSKPIPRPLNHKASTHLGTKSDRTTFQRPSDLLVVLYSFVIVSSKVAKLLWLLLQLLNKKNSCFHLWFVSVKHVHCVQNFPVLKRIDSIHAEFVVYTTPILRIMGLSFSIIAAKHNSSHYNISNQSETFIQSFYQCNYTRTLRL